MNNRMKQLAEQAGMHAFPPVMDYDKKETQWTGWDSNMKKFEELIVKECAEIDFYEVLRSSCNKEQSEELAALISSAIKAKGITE
jgi:hypothetical protein